MNQGRIPHLRVVVGFCLAALIGYAVFSAYVVFELRDPALTGDVIGTWKSFAVGVFAFWVGSSSGGKAKDDAPVKTEVVNSPSRPVPTQDAEAPKPPRGRLVPDDPDA